MAGHYGWLCRYEVYIWTFFLMILLYTFKDSLNNLLQNKPNNTTKFLIIITMLLVITGFDYLKCLNYLPIASNNIYKQQYQMHRFIKSFYKKPVAVNDIGYVSYKNPYYILDLWGLTSLKAYKLRTLNSPKNWYKIGYLKFKGIAINPVHKKVTFYVTKKKQIEPNKHNLKKIYKDFTT